MAEVQEAQVLDEPEEEEEEEDEDGEEGQDDRQPKSTIAYSSWDELCDDIEDDEDEDKDEEGNGQAPTHFRYRRFTAKRKRWCEGGKYFSLDAQSPAELPRPTSGDYQVQLYRRWQGQKDDGKPIIRYDPVDPDPTKIISVCFRGRPPTAPAEPPRPAAPQSFEQVQLAAYEKRHGEIKELVGLVTQLAAKPAEENKRLRKQLEKARKKIRKLEKEPQGLLAVIREVKELLCDPQAGENLKKLRDGGVLTALFEPPGT